jgi:poly(glycerol-phosphate) alpha-glucosyltransferase
MLEPWALENSRWKKRLAALIFENRNLRSADCLHALCEAEARNMRNYGLRNPIAVIPNGVDLSESREQKVESSNPPWDGIVEPGRKVLLFLSRIHPKKGLVNLLKAWAQIQRSAVSGQVVGALASDWTLAIAGWDQGGHEAELKCLAGEMGLAWADVRKQKSDAGGTNQNSDFSVSEFQLSSAREMASPISPGGTLTSDLRPPTSVLFLGPQFGDAKSACYANCDAFILPSFSEGVPMVVLEAWAHSKPVVMTPECNLPEGFTTNAAFRIETNIESIVRGLEQLLRSPFSNLCSLGANGRRLVSQQFAWPRIAKQMASVYAWLLGQGPKPDCVGLN